MKRVLVRHESRRRSGHSPALRGGGKVAVNGGDGGRTPQTRGRRSLPPGSSGVNGHAQVAGPLYQYGSSDGFAQTTPDTNQNGRNANSAQRDQSDTNHVDFMNEQLPDSVTARPVREQIPPSSLAVATLSDGYNAPHRRSLRQSLTNIYNDQGAELLLDLRNIRKKLNFSSSRPSGSNSARRASDQAGQTNGGDGEDEERESRPRKRPKRDAIECQCHITIWDNRTADVAHKPLVVESEKCYLTVNEGLDGSIPPSVNIGMPRPLVVRSQELEVNTAPVGKPPVLAVGDKYFLEIKIIPTHSADIQTGELWPPIPILSRSEGELFVSQPHANKTSTLESLHGALVARYTHLPTAPEEDVPLSVFYLRQGRCFKTKFGLEVSGQWMKKREAMRQMKIKEEEAEAESIKKMHQAFLDEHGNPFGRRILGNGHPRTSETASARSESRSASVSTSTATADVRRSSRRRRLQSLRGGSVKGDGEESGLKVEVSYVFEPKSKETSKESRTATLKGLRCPACRIGEFDSLNELRFHLLNSHHKYRFDLEGEETDPDSGGLKRITFNVTQLPPPAGRPKEIKDLRSEWEWNWESPREAFDIDAYVRGDSRWLGNLAPPPAKRPRQPPTVVISSDPRTAMRQLNGGFLPVSQVRDLPDLDAQRKKYPVVRTRTADGLPTFSSVGHWELRESDEMSETDDESQLVPGNWLREKHLAALADLGDSDKDDGSPGLSPVTVEFMQKWDGFRMGEGLSHPKFVADSLVRFCRRERAWLRRQPGATLELTRFLKTLKERRAVDDRVVGGCWWIVFGGPPPSPPPPPPDTAPPENGSNGTMTVVNGDDVEMSDANNHRHDSPVTDRPQSSPAMDKAEQLLSLAPGTCGLCGKLVLGLGGVRCANDNCQAPVMMYHYRCVGGRQMEGNWRCPAC